MIATAVLGFVQHHLLTLFAFTTGVLLVCDAWFDVLTARRGDFAVSILTAVLGELPIAAALVLGTLRIARLQGSPVRRPRWLVRLRKGSGRSARNVSVRQVGERSAAPIR